MRWARLLMAVAALSLAGCSIRERDDAVPALTEHQRDSVLSKSDLPGARVVDRALVESGRAAERSAAMDTLAR